MQTAYTDSPVIIGAGPAGLFCGLDAGKSMAMHPMILETGRDRQRIVPERWRHFWLTGELNRSGPMYSLEKAVPVHFLMESSIHMVKDPVGRNRKVLELFVEAGAPMKRFYMSNKPHLGTDELIGIVTRYAKRD